MTGRHAPPPRRRGRRARPARRGATLHVDLWAYLLMRDDRNHYRRLWIATSIAFALYAATVTTLVLTGALP